MRERSDGDKDRAATVFISSTIEDLEAYREAALGADMEVLAVLVAPNYAGVDRWMELNRLVDAYPQGKATPDLLAEVQRNDRKLAEFRQFPNRDDLVPMNAPAAAGAAARRLLCPGAGAGAHTLVCPPVPIAGESATITITVDKTFWVPGDHRELGIILAEVRSKPAE